MAGILPAAKASNIPVWGEIELFAQALAALRETRDYAPKVIAITGTNGKTTVTRMTGMLCERAGFVGAGGGQYQSGRAGCAQKGDETGRTAGSLGAGIVQFPVA